MRTAQQEPEDLLRPLLFASSMPCALCPAALSGLTLPQAQEIAFLRGIVGGDAAHNTPHASANCACV